MSKYYDGLEDERVEAQVEIRRLNAEIARLNKGLQGARSEREYMESQLRLRVQEIDRLKSLLAECVECLASPSSFNKQGWADLLIEKAKEALE